MNLALHQAAERASDFDSEPRVSLFHDNGLAYLYDRDSEACLTSNFVCDVEGWR